MKGETQVRVFEIETNTNSFVANGEIFSYFNDDRQLRVRLFKKSKNGRRRLAGCSVMNIGITGISENERIVEYIAHQNIRAMIIAYQNGVEAGIEKARKEDKS